MTVIPEPLEDGPERSRWFDEADRETRQAHPKYYWFHSYDGPPKFLWNETEVSEDEFRAKAEHWQLERLD
ncbi:MAG: hypothetical protein WCD52_28525 [Xanthobacteraceae bacterium]|jgi:hypothetical protein